MRRLLLVVVLAGTFGVVAVAGIGAESGSRLGAGAPAGSGVAFTSAPAPSGATRVACQTLTAKQLPSFVLRAPDMPMGTSVYSVYRPGGDRYLLLPPRTRASFGYEFNVRPSGAATALAMLFTSAPSASTGLALLKREYSGKRIPDGGLGEERWAISGRFGLPLGLHYGWRVKNVVLLFSLRGTSRGRVNPAGALRLAEKMSRRVHC